jgi:flavin-dependent dehydrogenase
MYSPSGKHLHLKLEEPFAVYSRIAFDSFLRDRARNAGAKVFAEKISAHGFKRSGLSAVQAKPSLDPVASAPGTDTADDGWIVRTQSGEEFGCQYLIGADGANSAIAKKLAGPLPPAEMEVAFGYRAPLPESQEAATVVAFLPKWVGYAWAFPRLDHVSFGIATTQDAFDHEKLDALLWEFMESYYESYASQNVTGKDAGEPPARNRSLPRMTLWKKEKKETQVSNLRHQAERYAARIPGLAPRTWDTRKACGDRWALLGDAAGFADPVTGEGIYYAIRSAELFADSYLAGKPQAYEQEWRKDFGAELKRASQMRQRFYGNFWGAPFTDRMIKFARGHRGIRQVLGRLVAGDQGYTDLKKKLARSALKPL